MDPIIFNSFRPEIQKLLNELEHDDIVYGEAIGPGGIRPELYDKLRDISLHFSEEEWNQLIANADPISFCYLLFQRVLFLDIQTNDMQITTNMHAEMLWDLILKCFSRIENVKTMFGCNKSKMYVADAVFGMIGYFLPDPIKKKLKKEIFNRKFPPEYLNWIIKESEHQE